MAIQVSWDELDPSSMTRGEFVEYLENTLIPDLLRSGNNCTATDFKAAILFIQGANEVKIGIDGVEKIC